MAKHTNTTFVVNDIVFVVVKWIIVRPWTQPNWFVVIGLDQKLRGIVWNISGFETGGPERRFKTEREAIRFIKAMSQYPKIDC